MDLDLSEDQSVLLAALDAATARYRDMGVSDRTAYHSYSWSLDDEMAANGFLDAATMEGMGLMDAALIVERIARLPYVMESGASALVLPHMGMALPRPIALLSASLDKAQRFLPVARTGLLDTGGELLAVAIDPDNVEAADSIYAYPYGHFRTLPDLSGAQRLGSDARVRFRQLSRVALAAEMSGAVRAAIDFTVAYVKERRMFGKVLGVYQSVHHRLAECDQIARGLHYMTMKAAWTGNPLDAHLAACYAQQHVKKLMFDLHQFNGAMGLTREHLLHFWTYRIRALQSEIGGADGAALDAADLLWSATASG